MNKTRKLVMSILTIVAVLAMMCVPAMADGTTITVPASTDTATVTINGIKPTVAGGSSYPTVTLYRIVKPVYATAPATGLLGYELAEGITMEDFTDPTQAEIEGIYADTLYSSLTGTTMTVTSGVATATVGAGMYVAVVTGAGTTVYNPMIVSVNYVTENGTTTIVGGEIEDGASLVLKDTTLYAKIQSPTPEKSVTAGTESDQSASVGDVVSYSIVVPVPQYPANASNKTFFVGDKAGTGLKLVAGSIKVNGTAASEKTYWDYAETDDGLGFNINFNVDDEDIAGITEVEVTYNMVVTDAAIVGTEGNTNTVKLYFAPDPFNGSTWEPTTPPDGQTGVTSTEDSETVYTYRVAFLKKDGNESTSNPLAGAKFGIYSDESCTTLVDVVTTNSDGYAASSQVKAGTYYLKELVPPSGYALNPTVYSVEASKTSATKTTTVTSRSYTSTKPSDDAVSVGWLLNNVFYTTDPGTGAVAAYISGETKTTGAPTTVEGDYTGGTAVLEDPIPNTPIKELPSTGGSGTYLFIIGGAALMALALFMALRKRSDSNK